VSGLPYFLFARLCAHRAVQHAPPVLSAYVRFNDQAQEPFLLIGIDPLSERAFRHTRWLAGNRLEAGKTLVRLLTQPFTIITSQALAGSSGLKVDDEVIVLHQI
jgi:hypothetical protein